MPSRYKAWGYLSDSDQQFFSILKTLSVNRNSCHQQRRIHVHRVGLDEVLSHLLCLTKLSRNK